MNPEGFLPDKQMKIMDEKKVKSFPYAKYPYALSYVFNPGEARFVLHMIEADFLKKQGYDTGWTRTEYMKRMGLNLYTFERCVRKLEKMNLLTRRYNTLGNRVYYSFNMDLYDRLVEILSATCHVDRLIDFCETKFKMENRSIESITEEEIEELKSGNGLKKIHPSMK